ncbi:MAG: guanylate kinase [Alphaproteobacteria bacterium]|nr:guanylate kinase [Alphaproteobacteria bacterium]
MKKASPLSISRRGFMLVLSSPSGAGKTTLARHVLEAGIDLELSISVTTRPQRASEKEGKDYFFVSEAEFIQLVKTNQFLEHAQVYGHHYGTPKASIEKHLKKGKDILFDIDWQGTQQLKQVSTGDLVSVFLLPPTMGALAERLHKRAEDREEVIQKRMNKAAEEMSHWAEYDYIVINNNLEESVCAVKSIIQAERLRRRRQFGLADFVNMLRDEI